MTCTVIFKVLQQCDHVLPVWTSHWIVITMMLSSLAISFIYYISSGLVESLKWSGSDLCPSVSLTFNDHDHVGGLPREQVVLVDVVYEFVTEVLIGGEVVWVGIAVVVWVLLCL